MIGQSRAEDGAGGEWVQVGTSRELWVDTVNWLLRQFHPVAPMACCRGCSPAASKRKPRLAIAVGGVVDRGP